MWFNFLKQKQEVKEQENKSVSIVVNKSSKATSDYVQAYENGAGKNTNTDTYFTAYKTSDLINSCVNYIAETGGLTKFKIKQKDKDGKLVPFRNKKVRALFDNAPNQFITWQEFIEQAIQNYLLTGNVFVSFERLSSYELWVLETSKVEVVPDKTNYVMGYLYNKDISFNTDEMFHIRRASSDNLYYGTSAAMECLKDSLLLEGYATADMKEFYENSSVGNGVLTTELPLTEPQIESIRRQFKENYGKNNGRHSTIILPEKMQYKSIKLSPKDAMLLDSLNISSDRVLRTFKMHKILLGGDVQSYSNKMDEIAKLVFNTAILPITNKIKEQLQLFFRTVLNTDNLYIIADYDNIPYLQTNIETKSDSLSKLVASGIISFNEARDELNLSQINNENYDKRFLPAYLLSGTPTTIDDYHPGMSIGQQASNPTTINPAGGTNLANGG